MSPFDTPSENAGLFNFSVDETAKGHLLETARWAKFLAIVGFVLLGILILGGVFMTFAMGRMGGALGALSGTAMLAVYVVLGVLYFFPTYYLFRFASLIKPALIGSDQQTFNEALFYLRKAFRFIGIVTLILLCLYALIFIVAIVAGAAFS